MLRITNTANLENSGNSKYILGELSSGLLKIQRTKCSLSHSTISQLKAAQSGLGKTNVLIYKNREGYDD